MLWLVLLLCGLALAQNSTTAETETCSPNMCSLLKQLGAMSEKLQTLETRLQQSETRLQNSESSLRDLKTRLLNSENKLKTSESQLRDARVRLQSSESEILLLKNRGAMTVAFSAAASSRGNNHLGPVPLETTVIFRTVIANIGNAYNSATGVFTAPVPGVYYFTFFNYAGGANRANLMLHKNNVLVVSALDQMSNDTGDSGGNAVYLKLARGDRVNVRLGPSSHVMANGYLTTFSGSLVNLL